LTVVEEVQDVSAPNAQAPEASDIKTRGSRRPRLSLEEKREIARLYADTSTSTSEICARLGIGESSLYRIVQLQGVPLRGRTAPSVLVGTPTRPVPAPARTQSRSSAGRRPGLKLATSGAVNGQAIASAVRQPPEPAVAPIAGGARAGTGSRRTAPVARRTTVAAPIVTLAADSTPAPTQRRRARTAEVSRSGELLQFTVTFLAEQTLQAASALDALQQAQARGATEVASIVRIA
jgi:transposase-like protein